MRLLSRPAETAAVGLDRWLVSKNPEEQSPGVWHMTAAGDTLEDLIAR